MNRPLFIGIVGAVFVIAAVALTFFIDRAPQRPSPAASRTTESPKAAAPQSATTTQPEAPVRATPKQAPSPSAVAGKQKKPSFDVVRISPRGDAVIAGRAEPQAEVLVKDGDKVIGKVKADARGEWVVVPKKPLPPGQRELSLSATLAKEPAVESDNKVVLVVPEQGKDIAGRKTTSASGSLAMLVPRKGLGSVRVLQTPGTQPSSAAKASDIPPAAKPEKAPEIATAPTPEKATAQTAAVLPTRLVARTQPSATAAPTAAAAKNQPVVEKAETKLAMALPAPEENKSGAKVSTPLESGAAKPGLALEAIEYDDAGKLALSGRAKAGTDVRVYIDNKHVGAASADKAGRWALEPEQKVQPGRYRMRVDQVDKSGEVKARVETRFVRAEPLGDLPPNSIVFVQPGNSLWRIARQTYGDGVRYGVIYEANKDQIRNPDLIYPGQVFHLPKVN